MLPRIAFGTAGLRGRMEAGFSGMNDLTVIQASQVADCVAFVSHFRVFACTSKRLILTPVLELLLVHLRLFVSDG